MTATVSTKETTLTLGMFSGEDTRVTCALCNVLRPEVHTCAIIEKSKKKRKVSACYLKCITKNPPKKQSDTRGSTRTKISSKKIFWFISKNLTKQLSHLINFQQIYCLSNRFHHSVLPLSDYYRQVLILAMTKEKSVINLYTLWYEQSSDKEMWFKSLAASVHQP